MKATFFETPKAFRAWLAKNHARASELWVGFHKRETGKPSITWPESVDEALCVGWIDGIRKSLGAESYVIRFTPRKAGSTWSAINIRRARELAAAGVMKTAGREAFARRRGDRSAIYAYEQRHETLEGEYARALEANRKARDFFRAQAAWYQKTASWWVVSAKKEETRRKRLAALIADSAKALRIPQLRRTKAGR